jgi:glycosyltransferase involved in cell wall biosynthesis
MIGTVLIGIVTRNRAAILGKAVASALAQRSPNASVVVLDDGSTDSTSEVARSYSAAKWIRWEQNQGLIEARNYLMRSARTKYFVSLDDDAWFMAGDEIARGEVYLEQNPNVAAIAFDILSPDRPHPLPRGSARTAAMFVGCGHMVRVEQVRQVGFYENAPGNYGGEEKDLCLRLIDAGYEIALLPGVHVFHDKTSVERHTATQHCSGVCNDLAMTFRRTPSLLLPIALLFKFIRHLLFSVKHHLTSACLDGFKLFVRSIPRLLPSRKPVKTATLRKFMRLHGP